MKTKTLFCANCQLDKEHIAEVDRNGDFVFTCDCGRFLKVNGQLAPEEVAQTLSDHKVNNEGQISIEQAQAEVEEQNVVLEEVIETPIPEPVIEEPEVVAVVEESTPEVVDGQVTEG